MTTALRSCARGDPEKKERKTAETDQIMPGDVVRVPERFF